MRRPFYLVVLVLLCCLYNNTLSAQTVWTNGGGDQQWFNPANWDNGLPANGNNATINNPATIEINLTANIVFDFDVFSEGTVNVNLGAFNLDYTGVYTNNNPGILSVYGTGGNFDLQNQIINTGQIFTNSSFSVASGGVLTNSAFIENNGTFYNFGTIDNTNGNLVNSTCSFFIAEDLSLESGGSFDQNGVLYLIGTGVVEITGGIGTILTDLNDNPSPTVICDPDPIPVALDINGDASISTADVDAGSSADYCPIQSLSLSQTDFDCDDVGPNTVTLTGEDGFGNTSSCDATVMIMDNISPIVYCPSSLSFNLLPGQCRIVVDFPAISATDNCNDLDLDQIDGSGLYSGDEFPIGETVITFQVTDPGGNTDDCSFSIFVNEFIPPSNAVTCNEDINISLDVNCIAVITPDMVLEGEYGCYEDFEVEVNDLGTNVIDYSLLGQTVTLTVTSLETGNSCWGEGTVEDKLPPQIIVPCQDTILNCLMNPDPISIGGHVSEPVFDDCSYFDVYYVDEVVPGDCTDPYMLQVTRIWTATDINGRVNECTQVITVESISITDVNPQCPPDYEFECNFITEPNFSPEITGYPTIEIDGVTYEIKENPGTPCGITAAYSDIDSIPKCGAGYRILRRWTIVDWCEDIVPGVNPIECFQMLDFVDHTPPLVSPPADLTLGTDHNECLLDEAIPAATILDCSDYTVITITPVGPIQGNGGIVPFPGLGVGTHTIIYRATDECGNMFDATTTIEVIDDVIPNPVCETFTVVSLNELGYAKVYALSLDDGSFDNCCIGSIETRRMTDNCELADNTEFRPFVEFCCADIFENVMVEMRVSDCHGNVNHCMVEVEVQDKKDPEIFCPSNTIIECDADIDDLLLTGQGFATDNCEIQSLEYEDEGELECGTGTITRTWTATDMSGTSITCEQIIVVQNTDPVDYDDITWPGDSSVDGCDIIPDPIDTGEPTVNIPNNCAQIALTYSDEIFDPLDGEVCRKLYRLWIVTDWCQYNPNDVNPVGRWEYTQTIKLEDAVAPEVSGCNNVTVCNFKADCSGVGVILDITAEDNCTDQSDITFSWTVDAFSDGIVDVGAAFSGTGLNTGNEYPNGTHQITYVVSDDCGNSTVCNFQFEIEDCKKPTVFCDGLIVENMQGGSIDVTADQFEPGSSSDNCTAYEDLIITFSPDTDDDTRTFGCDELGENEVEIWITDEAGNQDFCVTTLILQDNMGECVDGLMVDLGGVIENESNEGVENVMVEVNSDNYFMDYTNTTGEFAFYEMEGGEDYTVTPQLDEDADNGVTTFDLLLLGRHILGIQEITSPYKLIAGDANRSGTLTTLDIVAIRRVVLNIDDEFPNNTSWRFVQRDYEFPDPSNPFEPEFPEHTNLNNLATDNMDLDFIAIKTGDISGNATVNSLQSVDDRNSGDFSIIIRNQLVKTGELVSLEVTSQQPSAVLGYQFTLNYDNDALEFQELDPGKNTTFENFGLHLLSKGAITTSWEDSSAGQTTDALLQNNTVLFRLTFRAQADGKLSDWIHLNSRFTKAESYDKNGELMNVHLEFIEESGVAVASETFELYQNLPNPFKETAVIGFNLPEATSATLRIFDASGSVLQVIENNYAKGFNQIEISRNDLKTSGVLYYQLETPTNTASRKMILID